MGDGRVVVEDFDAFFLRTLPRIERLSVRILGRDPAAEDVAVEALARAYARWASVSRMDKPDAWVFRVATNLALDVIRRRRPLVPPVDRCAPHDDEVSLRQALVGRDLLGSS
jgi:RNA polymerase sigma-70 factor (ECF subfamily)